MIKHKNKFNADFRRLHADGRGFYPRKSLPVRQAGALDLRLSALKFIIFSLFVFMNSSCAPVLIGGAAVGGAVVIAQDFATTSIDASFQHVWSVANEELKKIGQVQKSFQKLGEIKATVEGSKVIVKISKLTEKTVDIKVSARKNLLPNTDLAQSILTAIIRHL